MFKDLETSLEQPGPQMVNQRSRKIPFALPCIPDAGENVAVMGTPRNGTVEIDASCGFQEPRQIGLLEVVLHLSPGLESDRFTLLLGGV